MPWLRRVRVRAGAAPAAVAVPEARGARRKVCAAIPHETGGSASF
jgi:pyocin large subunit-like protein